MAKIDIKELQESLPQWEFLKNLPRELKGFHYKDRGDMDGQHVLVLCSYEKPGFHRGLDLIYTKETFDFVPVKQVGLHSFRDLRYITRDKEEFTEVIPQVLERMLSEISEDYCPGCQRVLSEKGVPEWEYGRTLPETIGRFQLFITPEHPFEYINNSIILIDYADFEKGDELYFMYNRVRNEFFAEKKVDNIPKTIHDFDADNLKQLEKHLKEKLVPYLEKM